MSIKITGMYSGLDTESIINELASAQSYKKNKLVKAQTKLSWKQDAWKALNTKIYSFYTNVLDELRYQSSYSKKTTKVSNSNAIQIVSGDSASNGTSTVQVTQLAKTAYLTGGSLQTDSGVCFSGKATLKQLGFSGEGSVTLTGANGASMDFTLTEDMTINDVVSKLKTSGLNASYDQNNQRIFLSSSNSGAINDFSVTANDQGGLNALSALGLLSANDIDCDTYKTWAGYETDTEAYQKVQDAEVATRAASYKAANDKLEAENELIRKNNETNQANLEKLEGYDPNETLEDVKLALYGTEVTQNKKDENGYDIPILNEDGSQAQDDDGNLLYETETVTVYESGSVGEALDSAQKALEAKKQELTDAKADGSGKTDDEIAALEQEVADASGAVSDAQKAFDTVKLRYDFLDGIKQNEDMIQANQDQIDANAEYYELADPSDPDSGIVGSDKLKEQVKADFDEKKDTALEVVNNADTYKAKATATKVDGQDAEILMNGAKFTSMDNSFTINNLSFKVLETTSNEVTLTTAEDTDGIYDMIKNFFSEYNTLINEIDSLYNADSASDYEPLLSEEKDSMSDSEIEDWEQKIKDALLRRDSTLGSVGDAMKNILLQGVSVNGTQMYLSSFGINTLGYFSAAENEKNAYHIDGNSDDENSTVRSSDDVLKSMIASNPDTVMDFFTGLANNLHDTLYNLMGSSTMSSAFTVYNDKQMSDEYDDYTDKISDQEDKLNDLIDKWYSKFSAMETALSKLDSKSSSLSSLLGG